MAKINRIKINGDITIDMEEIGSSIKGCFNICHPSWKTYKKWKNFQTQPNHQIKPKSEEIKETHKKWEAWNSSKKKRLKVLKKKKKVQAQMDL